MNQERVHRLPRPSARSEGASKPFGSMGRSPADRLVTGEADVTARDTRSIRGQCLCGRVAFQATLHRSARNSEAMPTRPRRRRADTRSGLVFDGAELAWLNGKTLVGWFEFAPGIHRGFCTECGTRLLNRYDFAFTAVRRVQHDSTERAALGGADLAVLVDSRGPWFEIEDDVVLY